MLDLHDMPGHLIRRLNQVSVSLFMEEATKAGYDLTPVQFAALSAIEAYPGADQATISGVIAYDRVTIGGVVDRLTQKGFVRRGVSLRDKRARVLHLTEAGAATLAAMRPVVARIQDMILAGLQPAERETLMTLLRKLAATGNSLSRAPLVEPEG